MNLFFLTRVKIQNLRCRTIFFSMAQHPLLGQAFLFIEASPSHTDTPHAVGLLWTSDQPHARPLPYKTQHSQEADIHAPAEFEPEIPESQRPQMDALDRAATGIGVVWKYFLKYSLKE